MGGIITALAHLVARPQHHPEIMQPHGHHGEEITHALSGIPEGIGNTAMALEASIAVLDGNAGFGQGCVVRLLCWRQLVFGFPLLFAFAFERRDDQRIANL